MPNNTENVTTKFRVDISDLKQNITEANKQIKLANAQFKNATAGMDDWSESADGLSAKIEQQNAIVDAEKKKLQALQQQLARLNAAQEKGERIIADLTEKYNEAVEAYGATSDEAKQYAKQLQDAQKAQQRNAGAVEKLNLQIINQDTAVKNATAQADRYDAQLDELRRSTDYLKQRQADLTAEYEQAVAQYGRNSTEAARLSAELRDVSRELRNAENAAEDADGAAEKLEGGFTVAKAAIANFISDGINALLSKLGEAIQYLGTFGNEFDDAMNSFQASTGASAAEMAKFEESVKRIYNNNYGDGFEDIAAAMATVKQQAGDIGADELERMTTRAIMLRDTFDFDVNESIRTVEMMMQQFGVTSDEAFNLLAQGAQEGLDKNGDLLDTINEYSVHYRQQGYSAEEFFNSLKNGTEAGTFSVDKLGDAMKEFGIRAKDNSDSTRTAFADLGLDADKMTEKFAAGGDASRDAMQQVTDALFGMNDQVKQNEIGVALFGTMWEDLGADGVKALLDVNGEINNTKDALSEIDRVKYDSVGNAIQGIRRNLETGILMPISDKLLPKIQELSDKFADWLNDPKTQAKIQEFSDKFADFAENGIDKVVTAFTWIIDHKDGIIAAITGIAAGFVAFKVVSTVQAAITALQGLAAVIELVGVKQAITNAIMAANPIGLIIAAIAGLVAAFVYLWKNNEGFREFWINLWETLKEKCGAAWEAIKGFFSAAWEYIKTVWGAVSGWFSGVWESIKETFAPVAKVIGGFFKMAWENIKVVWNVVVKYFKTIWENIKSVFSAVKSVLSGDFSGAWDAIKRIFANVGAFFGDVWGALKNIFANVDEFFGGIFSGAWDKIKGVWVTVSGWFNDHVVTPIKNFFAPIVEWFSQLFGSIWATVKSVFEVIGQLAAGCVTLIKTVWGAVSAWFNERVVNPVKNFFAGLWDSIKNAASTAWEFIKTVWAVVSGWFKETVVDPVVSFFSGLWNSVKAAASTAWAFIKGVWQTVSGWFNSTIIQPVSRFFSGMWDKLKSGASQAWEGIKSVFGKVSDWFKDKFSDAWQKVKDVFSTGGKVFDGIKDGIVSAFKTVVNAIIRGINKVIQIPFNAINGILDRIQNVDVLGVRPFDFLTSRINVPQIPELAQGGIVNRRTLATIGEDGAEAVLPLEKNKAGLKQIAQLLAHEMKGGGAFGGNGDNGGGTQGGDTIYNFNQTNNSPKSLSRYEIYRQTKNLINAVKNQNPQGV